MQTAVIEFARNVCGLTDADSAEFSKNTQHKVIDLMPDQNSKQDKGGTMRLGAYPCEIKPDTVLRSVYGKKEISERHRHRYEFNNDYREIMTQNGLTISGTSPDGKLVEAVEIEKHPFFVGVQFHPEFLSRPDKAHPLFKSFIKKSLEYRENK
jgi:CTP synthase